jgi:hypothetical protein
LYSTNTYNRKEGRREEGEGGGRESRGGEEARRKQTNE